MASVIGDEQEPFWWMSHSSLHSSTPTKPTEKGMLLQYFNVWAVTFANFCILIKCPSLNRWHPATER